MAESFLNKVWFLWLKPIKFSRIEFLFCCQLHKFRKSKIFVFIRWRIKNLHETNLYLVNFLLAEWYFFVFFLYQYELLFLLNFFGKEIAKEPWCLLLFQLLGHFSCMLLLNSFLNKDTNPATNSYQPQSYF